MGVSYNKVVTSVIRLLYMLLQGTISHRVFKSIAAVYLKEMTY